MTIALMLVVACLASNAAAQSCSGCTQSSCPYSQEWNAKSFLEDTPTETGLSATGENAIRDSDKSNSSIDVPALSVDLKNASAEPNPVNLGRPVRITAVLSENSAITNVSNMAAYAIIRNSVGIQVGNVNLEHTSGNEYDGVWNASIATGTYNAAIMASASGVSKTFDNAMQIEVIGSDNTTGNTRTYKKLG